MSLPQENLEDAVTAATGTLSMLGGPVPQMAEESIATLRAWLWDLEAVAAAIRSELATRDDQPVDFG